MDAATPDRHYERLSLMHTYIGKSRHGRGVFARHHIWSGTIIDICPVLVFADSQSLSPDHSSYEWQEGSWCIVLGHGSIYNHSARPNAQFVRDYENVVMLYVSLRHIDPDEEIRINYNGNIYSRRKQWFEENPQKVEPSS